MASGRLLLNMLTKSFDSPKCSLRLGIRAWMWGLVLGESVKGLDIGLRVWA